VLWLVPGLALTKSKINSGELTDKYPRFYSGEGQAFHYPAATSPGINHFTTIKIVGVTVPMASQFQITSIML